MKTKEIYKDGQAQIDDTNSTMTQNFMNTDMLTKIITRKSKSILRF